MDNDTLQIVLVMVIGLAVVSFFSIGWLLNERRKREQVRIQEIASHMNDWGEDSCRAIASRKVAVDMTSEMVELAWGTPSNIDRQEVTKRGTGKMRYIYGLPRTEGVKYVWFTNGTVTKMKV